MLKWLMRRGTAAFERQWNYDASYVHDLIEADPRAAWMFQRAAGLGKYRKDVPPAALFAAPAPALGRPLRHRPPWHSAGVGPGRMRDLPPPTREAPAPDLQRLRRSRPPRGGALIQTCGTGGTRSTLPGGLRRITAARPALLGLPRGAGHTVWPGERAHGLRTLHRLDQLREVDRHQGTPGRGLDNGMASGYDSLKCHDPGIQ